MRKQIQNFVLSAGLYSIFMAYRKYQYYMYKYNDDIDMIVSEVGLDILCYESFEWYYKKYPRLYKVCLNMYISKCRKVKRVHDRIIDMLYTNDGEINDCLFVTLTFSNDVLDKTTQKTRRVYVSRFLKSQFKDYVANIDFGDKYNREHYHAIIGSGYIDLSAWFDKQGIIHVEHIRSNSKKIAQYINKLTYHSVKDSAGYLIYSKKNAVAKAF